VGGLVDIPSESRYHDEKQIILKEKFVWFLTHEFADLKEKASSISNLDNNTHI
jgi:hypothetical protein